MTYEQSIDYLNDLASNGDLTITESITRGTFIYGYCGLYAAALAAQYPGWLVVAVGSNECQLGQQDCSEYADGFCDCHLDHFYVMDRDGWYHDAFGQHDPDALDHLTHRPIGDEAFRGVLESWYGFDRDSMDIAAVAQLWAAEPEVNVVAPC
jgi:hypothetical protein